VSQLRHSGWVVAAVAFVVALKRIADTDVWWHLAAGRWMWEHHAVVTVDPFALTGPGAPWVSLTWGYELLCYGAWSLGGAAGVGVLHAAAAAGAAVFAWKLLGLLLEGASPLQRAASEGLWLGSLLLVDPRWKNRPEVFTHLCGMALIWALAEFRATRISGRALVAFIAVAQVFWANTHGAFLLGPLIVGAYAAASLLEKRSSSDSRGMLFWAAGAALLACFAQPRGWTGVEAALGLGRALSDPTLRGWIVEAMSPFAGAWGFDTTAFCLFAVLAPLATFVRRRRDSLAPFAISLLLAALAASARRNAALFTLWTAPFVAEAVGAWLAAGPLAPWLEPLPAAAARASSGVAAALVALLAMTGVHRGPHAEFGTGVDALIAPVEAAEFLARLPTPPRAFAGEETADYLMFAVPGYRSYVDTRHAEVQTREQRARYREILANPPLLSDEARKLDLDTLILRHTTLEEWPLFGEIARNPRWRLAHLDPDVAVFRRSDGNSEDSGDAVNVALARARAGLGAAAAQDKHRSLLLIGDALLQMGHTEEASRAVSAALALDPAAPDGQAAECRLKFWVFAHAPRKGDVPASAGLAETAWQACVQALSLGSRDPSVDFAMGDLTLVSGDALSAAERFDRYVRSQPESYDGWMARSEAYSALGRRDEVLRSLLHATQAAPSEAEPRRRLAELSRATPQSEAGRAP
jgi:tetratricopeptide (TPR) repeat protein